MDKLRKPSTAPRDGSKFLAYVDFQDEYPTPGWFVVRWKDDPRGFNLVCGDDGGGWHERGLVGWRPLPTVRLPKSKAAA